MFVPSADIAGPDTADRATVVLHIQVGVHEIARELDDLGALTDGVDLRAKLHSVRSRMDEALAPRRTTVAVDLSPREVEVLQQIARGPSNNDISEALGLLPNTVKTDVKTAMRKLDASNRGHATVLARNAGLVT